MRASGKIVTRLKAFESLETHAWLGRVFKRLSKSELAFCLETLRSSEHMSKGDFELKVNRLFLDREKPKNSTIIMELLSCANSQIKDLRFQVVEEMAGWLVWDEEKKRFVADYGSDKDGAIAWANRLNKEIK